MPVSPKAVSTRFVSDRAIYEQVIRDAVPRARAFLWIATADIKDLYVHRGGARMAPFLGVLSELLDRGVSIRLIHAKEPGPAFRRDFDRYPNLAAGLEMILCPRCHFKSVLIDGHTAYLGSANLTGAGMGAKGPDKRNFEHGILTTDPALVEPALEQFDRLWMGAPCPTCARKQHCVTWLDLNPDGA